MPTLLQIVGFIWGGIGVLNVIGGFGQNSEAIQSISIAFNGFVFVLPGLVLLAIGAHLRPHS